VKNLKVKDLTKNYSEARQFYLTLSIITLVSFVAIMLASLELLDTPEGYSLIIVILAVIVLLIVYSAEKIYAIVFEIRLNTMEQPEVNKKIKKKNEE